MRGKFEVWRAEKARAEIWVKFEQIGRVNSDKFWLNSRQNLTRSTKKIKSDFEPEMAKFSKQKKAEFSWPSEKIKRNRPNLTQVSRVNSSKYQNNKFKQSNLTNADELNLS